MTVFNWLLFAYHAKNVSTALLQGKTHTHIFKTIHLRTVFSLQKQQLLSLNKKFVRHLDFDVIKRFFEREMKLHGIQ